MSNAALKRVVLLGTGTDVGKTYVGVALTRALRARGREVLALKPVESGLVSRPELAAQGDAASLARVATQGAPPLFGLADPISPHLAARREGLSITTREVLRWVEEQERACASRHPGALSLIETAGGCFSPLSADENNYDWARALDPALWILVAPDSLGVLHDIQATLRAMDQRWPDLLVLSLARPPDASTGTNAHEVERVVYDQLLRGRTPPGPLPRLMTVARAAELPDIAQWVDDACFPGKKVPEH